MSIYLYIKFIIIRYKSQFFSRSIEILSWIFKNVEFNINYHRFLLRILINMFEDIGYEYKNIFAYLKRHITIKIYLKCDLKEVSISFTC